MTFLVPGVGEWKVDHCLWIELRDPLTMELLNSIVRFEKHGILPQAGGWYDQTEAFLQAWDYFQAELSSYGRGHG